MAMERESLRSDSSETADVDIDSLMQSQEQIITGDGIALQIQYPETPGEQVRKHDGQLCYRDTLSGPSGGSSYLGHYKNY